MAPWTLILLIAALCAICYGSAEAVRLWCVRRLATPLRARSVSPAVSTPVEIQEPEPAIAD